MERCPGVALAPLVPRGSPRRTQYGLHRSFSGVATAMEPHLAALLILPLTNFGCCCDRGIVRPP